MSLENSIRGGSLELQNKGLKLGGDLDIGSHKILTTNLLLKEQDQYSFIAKDRLDTMSKNFQLNNLQNSGLYNVNLNSRLDVASQRVYPFKVFTSSPVLANMEIGEIALGDGTGTGGLDEWFFKPDASKIVALASDGSARTITS